MTEPVIYWFSATGNSLSVAKRVAQTLDGELRPMVQHPGGRVDGERVGFVFPLYYLGYPQVVAEFFRRLAVQPGQSFFALVTRGVPGMGGVLRLLDRDLKARGARLDQGYYVEMPNNELTLFSIAPPEANATKLARAGEHLEKILTRLHRGDRHLDGEPLRWILDLRQKAYQKRIRSSHTRFFADGRCTGCGRCARLCPLDRIDLHDDRPRWAAGCQECQACINLCPRAAIQYRGGQTEGKRRYRHPEVSWLDIAAQQAPAVGHCPSGSSGPSPG